jgi:hypothetical protein
VTVLTMATTTFVPSQTSIAVGGVNVIGPPHSMFWLGAHVMTGGLVSRTLMV